MTEGKELEGGRDSAPPSDSAAESYVRTIAEQFRRVGRDQTDRGGRIVIWHRSRLQTEMLSWETHENVIEQQELSFAGMIVVYKKGRVLRTGRAKVEEGHSDAGQARAKVLDMDHEPELETLRLASFLMKHVSHRDYYCQNLLKEVNRAIRSFDFDDDRTVVSDVSGFSRRLHDDIRRLKLEDKDLSSENEGGDRTKKNVPKAPTLSSAMKNWLSVAFYGSLVVTIVSFVGFVWWVYAS